MRDEETFNFIKKNSFLERNVCFIYSYTATCLSVIIRSNAKTGSFDKTSPYQKIHKLSAVTMNKSVLQYTNDEVRTYTSSLSPNHNMSI